MPREMLARRRCMQEEQGISGEQFVMEEDDMLTRLYNRP
jgi:hypothetical protein